MNINIKMYIIQNLPFLVSLQQKFKGLNKLIYEICIMERETHVKYTNVNHSKIYGPNS